jgi:hypothetical protein
MDDVEGAAGRPGVTEMLTRGVRRALVERGYASLTEFRLASGRRADVLAVNEAGEVVIVEVKSSVAPIRNGRNTKLGAIPSSSPSRPISRPT